VNLPNPGSIAQPPAPNEKEKKVRVTRGKIVQAIAAGGGFAAEFLDFSNALYDALPDRCKPGMYQLKKKGGTFWKRRWRPSQTQRNAALVSCWDHIDIEKAVQNLVVNQITDAGIGFIGKTAKEAYAASGGRGPLGLQSGPWDTIATDQWKDFKAAEQRKKDAKRYADEKKAQAIRQARAKKRALDRSAKRSAPSSTGR
jgi:hypothetical protein